MNMQGITQEPSGSTGVRRNKTLVKPARQEQSFMVARPSPTPQEEKKTLWVLTSQILTCWAPSFILSNCGIKVSSVQQAWREKVTLCLIIAFICAIVLFFTMFLQQLLCPPNQAAIGDSSFESDNTNPGLFNVRGYLYQISDYQGNIDKWSQQAGIPGNTPIDLSNIFINSTSSDCNFEGSVLFNSNFPCQDGNNCISPNDLPIAPVGESSLKWDDVKSKNYIVVDGNVLDFSPLFSKIGNPPPTPSNPLDRAVFDLYFSKSVSQRDLTRKILEIPNIPSRTAIDCLSARYRKSMRLEKTTTNCVLSNVLFIVFLIVILMIVLARFFMALIFSWVLSGQLAKFPNKKKCISYPPAPIDPVPERPIPQFPEAALPFIDSSDAMPNELYTVLLVTCYSEGEESLRSTLDSLSATIYSDSRKLLFVISDGIVTGSGNAKSTPDLLIDMIEVDPAWGSDPSPYSYIAIAAGSKQHNMAKVYAGHYLYQGRRVPMILVIKCGAPEERDSPKPGNRGKRDSQIILMGFFTRVLFNERMVPLDFDIFRKVHYLMGVTPDFFETVLMVDADTKVMPDSVTLLNNAVINDPNVMGLAGETRITNKRTGFVTGIQVFEYYISHHLGKAFESVFGGVTCLPGCFCMYRLKAPGKRPNEWIPILTKPEVLEEYSQSVVETLHEKNLLLLGEDRFLTTLMLKSFPHRKMMFVPQSVCKTVVPDEFKVLLSQRRRWINSTVHNLLELVLVRNLCGTFCLSMQFVIFMELVGTVSLPVAIIMTYYLIISLTIQGIKGQLQTFQQIIPLLLLVTVLFLPAILILVTTRKWVYVMWMFVYLIGLPIWNFVLPVYAYWHFDDFTWGDTRKVDGGGKDDHGSGEGTFDHSKVPRKRWEEYERAWQRHIKRKKKQQQQFQQGGQPSNVRYPPAQSSSEEMSDTSTLPRVVPQQYYNRQDIPLQQQQQQPQQPQQQQQQQQPQYQYQLERLPYQNNQQSEEEPSPNTNQNLYGNFNSRPQTPPNQVPVAHHNLYRQEPDEELQRAYDNYYADD